MPAAGPQQYDVVVVCSGPAGLSAAVNVANRRRTVTVFTGQSPLGRIGKAHAVSNYLGFASVSGEELTEAFLHHLEGFEVPLVREKVSKIIPDADGFVVFSEREIYRAGAVVLATGVYSEAEIEGEAGLIGQGVSYCVTCDGRLFTGRRAAFVSYSVHGEEEASALAEDYGVDVTYFALYEGEVHLPEGVRVVGGAPPTRLTQVDGRMQVSLPGEDLEVDAVFIYKESVSPRALLDGIATDGHHIAVDRRMATSVPGVFAAGDCTGEPYQTAKAVGEGQVAALEAVRLVRKRAKSASPDAE
jgi:thioredoxin reductase (NADPH)